MRSSIVNKELINLYWTSANISITGWKAANGDNPDRDVKKQNENPSIGVLLCKDKDREVVEYALSRSLSPTMVSEYHTLLPDKKLLQKKLHELFEDHQSKMSEQAEAN